MDNKNKKLPKEEKIKTLSQILPQEGKGKILSDVNGSYTGTPIDSLQPTQDADDL